MFENGDEESGDLVVVELLPDSVTRQHHQMVIGLDLVLQKFWLAGAPETVGEVVSERSGHGQAGVQELSIIDSKRPRMITLKIFSLRYLASCSINSSRLLDVIRFVIVRKLLDLKIV